MKLAFLYAGQGSQKVGMGRDLYEAYPAFRTVWDDAAVDFDLKTLCWEGPEETLSQTRYTQPCMVAFAAGITAVLREEGIVPSLAAGLSLGEYSALHAAGVWDAAQAVSLASFRGRAMEEAVRDRSCGMVAVLGLSREALADICRGDRQLQLPRPAGNRRRCRRGGGGLPAGPGGRRPPDSAAEGQRTLSHFLDGPGWRGAAGTVPGGSF